MTDPRNATVALLLASAVILSILLAGAFRDSGSAAYADTSVKYGNYVMVPGARSATTDLLYVVDTSAKRLNVYETNINTNALDLVDSIDLERAFR